MNRNRRKMAGRWLGGCPLLFPKIAGFVLNRCKMAGRWFAWLALAISYKFGFDFGSLGDGWRWLGDSWKNTCCIITPNKKEGHQYNTQPYSTHTTQHRMAGWLALVFSRTASSVNSNCREMAGRWLGGWPHLFPKIPGVIPDRCKMVGRCLGGWHQLVPTISFVIVCR